MITISLFSHETRECSLAGERLNMIDPTINILRCGSGCTMHKFSVILSLMNIKARYKKFRTYKLVRTSPILNTNSFLLAVIRIQIIFR